jgi:menaquinone-dependent protoporphyrinogen oxidase
MPAVLVTWATRFGSTEEVAHAIADDLLQQRFAVNALPMNEVKTLERYQAIVMGFALYIGRMHKDARRFLVSHHKELARLPVALFVLGPVHADQKEFTTARSQLQKELAKLPWLSPIAQEVFGGKFDPKTIGFPFTFISAMRNLPPSDARDWDTIHAWSTHLATTLQPAMAP